MTIEQIYRKTKDDLNKAGIEAPAFEALCLIEKVFGYNRTALIIHGNEPATDNKINEINGYVQRRLALEPLQYILGKWSFMGIDLLVGDGVLIPRDDTEMVTGLCLEYLEGKENAKVIDLCAGSGAICLAVEKFAKAEVSAVELSEKAFSFLKRNIELNNSSVNAVNADIFECTDMFEDMSLDLIVSNPPYIKRDEIKTLQAEVQKEPVMALDGGEDGFDFYRKIVPLWKSKLKAGGAIAFELGENQFEEVAQILTENGFTDIRESLDMSNIQRAIIGTLHQK